MANLPGTLSNEEQAKRHTEVMDSLHTIGRNIAQSDATHRRIVLALEGIGVVLMSFGAITVVLTMVAISMVLR